LSGTLVISGVLLGGNGVYLLAGAGFGVAPIYPTVMAVLAKLFGDRIASAMTFTVVLMSATVITSNLLVGAIINTFGYHAGYAFIGFSGFVSMLGAIILYTKLRKKGDLI
jgi:MFS family permease